MSLRTPQRFARVEARINFDTLAIVRRAAEIQGCSVSDFLVAAAQEAAYKALAELEVLQLSSEGQEQFVSLLLNPPPAAEPLLRAMKRHRALIVEG